MVCTQCHRAWVCNASLGAAAVVIPVIQAILRGWWDVKESSREERRALQLQLQSGPSPANRWRHVVRWRQEVYSQYGHRLGARASGVG